ncbi:MAG: PadR family transcriptional regulator [Candidatus Thorarchaeota archaeon]|nr:PadR family transcriptional regulator [Candidatus Thorarchaeota archaeon]
MNKTDPENCEDLSGLQSIPRGFLRLLLARLLSKRELTGTQIMEILEERSEGEWRPSPGSIYPMLNSMEEHGLIETVRTEGRSKIYALSQKGHDHFKETFRRKGDVEGKTRLHRAVWMQMLDPVDQAFFHVHGMQIALEHITQAQTQLTVTQREKLRTKLSIILESLEELIKIMGD